MEKGQLRCDCNISVRPQSETELGAKIEIKNLNSISGVATPLAYEIRVNRCAGERRNPSQETRGWNDAAGERFLCAQKNSRMISYFPDPDLSGKTEIPLGRSATARA